MTNAVPNPFWQFPPAPKPPNDPTWWLLNGRVGWQAAALDDVAIAGEGLGLLIIPGSGRLLTEASGSFGGLVLPGNAAQAADGSLYLLDAQAGQLKRFDPCDCRFQTVLCLGGVGTGARQLQDPHGIGICSGNLFICDTGNHRLLIFSLFGFVLRDSWTPPASANLTNPWQPYSVTFDNHRLLIFSLFGFVLRDSWTPPASANLTNPWQPYSVTFDNDRLLIFSLFGFVLRDSWTPP